MKRVRIGITVLLVVSLLDVGIAYAQAARTWVSGTGDDANPCSRTAPCKTFAGAISKTAARGEISALDPSGFGSVTITKSITLSGDGTLAGILNSNTNGVRVQAGVNDTVVLRNLSIASPNTGAPYSGLNGVVYTSGGGLIIEHCSISGMSLSGVEVSMTTRGALTITDTSIVGGSDGVHTNSTARLDVELRNVTIRGSGNGVNVQAGFLSIHDSLITNNSGVGVLTQGGKVVMEGSTINSNDTAVKVLGGFARLSNTSFYNNSNGLVCTGGPITSTYDNRKGGNVGGTLPACAEPLPAMVIL